MSEKKTGRSLARYVSNYVVFDLETTGVSAQNDEIIEISALKVKQGEVTETFSTLINPGRSIPYQATKVNGITDKMVEEAPAIKEVLSEFLEFIEDEVLVGHNIRTFDLKFVERATQEAFGRKIENDFIDTLPMSRSCLPQLKYYKLTDIAAHFKIAVEGAHRALGDCVMNQKCFEELGKIQKDLVLEICPKCGSEMKKRNGKFGEFWGCGNYPECRHTKKI